MKNIDFYTLNRFIDENIDFFIGARLQKIQQPTRRDFIFTLRNNTESRKFYININPQNYHIAFMNSFTEKRRNLVIPKQPPMFCMLLRKYLEGCKIIDTLAVENERIIEFHFETLDEFSQKRLLCLAIELMGKHSNVVLYDRETKVIIGCAHNIGPEKSRYRELQGGLKYIYPPKVNETQKITTTLYEFLLNEFSLTNTISDMLDEYYSTIQEKNIINIEKSKLQEIVRPKLRKTKNALEKITLLLKQRDNTEKYKLCGELLTANLFQKKDYSKNIEVQNYYSGEKITIDLDATKTLNENAQRYYKLYAKSKATKEKSKQVLENLQIEERYLENVLYSIQKAQILDDLEDIKAELGLQEIAKNAKKSIVNPLDTIQRVNIQGFEVFIGKNNKQNDFIISKLSKDEDYWFHTRLCAGSHVLLKINDKEPNEEVLFECCKLAREHSSAVQPSKVGVIYTKRKFIKKPPAAPLGYVIYKNEKEVLV